MQRRGGFGELSEKLVAGLLSSLLMTAATIRQQQQQLHDTTAQ